MANCAWCVFNLPGDVLFPLFENWLHLRDIARLDSATCNHSLRPHFLGVLTKCTVYVYDCRSCIDGHLWWRSIRHVKSLPTLKIFQNVSDSFARHGECSEASLANVHTLSITQSGSTNVSNWLGMIVPLCRNVRWVYALNLTEQDVPWLRALAQHASHLTHLCLKFAETPEKYTHVLKDFRMCESLKVVELNYVDCLKLVHSECIVIRVGASLQDEYDDEEEDSEAEDGDDWEESDEEDQVEDGEEEESGGSDGIHFDEGEYDSAGDESGDYDDAD